MHQPHIHWELRCSLEIVILFKQIYDAIIIA